jgi:hypothetical protein
VHLPPTDLRKSFDGLTGLVRSAFQADPRDGSWFLFFNHRRDRVKILAWEPDGFSIWYKRLKAGTFETLRVVADGQTGRSTRPRSPCCCRACRSTPRNAAGDCRAWREIAPVSRWVVRDLLSRSSRPGGSLPRTSHRTGLVVRTSGSLE